MKPYYQDAHCTIYQGDAREIVPQLGHVDFIFTDPPYGHFNNDKDLIAHRRKALGKNWSAPEPRPIRNDDPETASSLARWLFQTAAQKLRCCCCCCCCCCGGGPDPQFARWSLWMDESLEFKQMVVWDKGWGMGWHYRRCYEVILVAQKGKGKTHWFDRSRAVKNIIRPGDYGIRRIIPRAQDHPTPKPVELAAHFIRLHTPAPAACARSIHGRRLDAGCRQATRTPRHWNRHRKALVSNGPRSDWRLSE